VSTRIRSFADLLRRIGSVPPDRIRFQPAPGTATIDDVIRICDTEGVLCELIEGVLVEKAMGLLASRVASYFVALLNNFVIPRNLGFVTGADGAVELLTALVRIPDAAFVSWDRTPDRRMPAEPVPRLAPNLAIEVHGPGNRPGEMAAKREDYFNAGVELVWEIDPDNRTATVYTAPSSGVTLGPSDALDGGAVLPGFRLPLSELFAELDRHG
jgi:Uma2 family endonuclease